MLPLKRGSTRRAFLGSAMALASLRRSHAVPMPDRAHIAITLDLEMSAQYPTRDQTHWNYEKGNLDAGTKRYALEAAQRVAERSGLIHFFALGRTMEQEDVSWLKTIAGGGHRVGNHTYDHVNVTARRPEDLQFQ